MAVKHHFRLLAEVRWQVFRNQLRQKRKKEELAARLTMALLALVAAVGIGLLLGGAAYASSLKGRYIVPGLLWAVFLVWQGAPLLLEGASPSLNFREIARYPVSFRLYYLLNTAYGLLDPAALLCLVWLGAIWTGMTLARPAWAFRAAILFLVFALINLLFNRVLFGFLERLLSTRRGRERFIAAMLFLLVFGQLGMILLVERAGKKGLGKTGRVLARIERFSPPSLASRAIPGGGWAGTAAALGGLAAYAGAAALVLRRQLRRNYQGEVTAETPAVRGALQVQPGWKLPFLGDSASAMVEKELLYLLRSPQAVIGLLVPIVVAVMATLGSGIMQKALALNRLAAPSWLYPGMVGYLVLVLGEQAYNSFGFDAGGFHRWLMAPASLRRVFVVKNATLALLLTFNFLAVTVVFRAGSHITLKDFLVVSVAWAYASLATFGAGNLFSAWYPVGVDYGRLSGKKVSEITVLLRLLANLLIVGSLILVFYGARRWNLDLLPPVAFSLLALLGLKFYLYSLEAASEYTRAHAEEIAAALA